MSMQDLKFFRPIVADEYVRQGIVEGRLQPVEVRKSARIKARQGKVGEEITTILPSGLKEVGGVVRESEQTGRPGWIATNPGGEEYIIEDHDFQALYMADPEHPGEFKKKVPALAVQIDENVAFSNKWGEEFKVEAGGYLVFHDGARGLLGTGAYGVDKDAWAQTYEPTGKDAKEALKQAIAAYGITREEMEEARRPKTEGAKQAPSDKKSEGHGLDD